MNEKLIKQLREGTIAIGNYSTLEEIRKVLRYAFPLDNRITNGLHLKYIASNDKDFWVGVDTVYLPTHSVKEFLKPESEYPKVMKVSMFPIKTKEQFENARTRVVFMKKKRQIYCMDRRKNNRKVRIRSCDISLELRSRLKLAT